MSLSARPESSRHKCLIYEGHPSEQLPIVVPLLTEALQDEQRCLYLGDPETVSMVRQALSSKGVDVEAQTRRGALIFSSERAHLDAGAFDPDAMVGMLRRLIDESLRDGFKGLCATGDMRWELGPDANFERLREYEAKLERLFEDLPLRGVCQYHRGSVPPRAIEDALATHQAAYVGQELNSENLFYIPPDLLLAGAAGREKLAEWMWQQLRRLQAAERQRDKAWRELQALNRELEARVRERTRELEAFSYAVSHDLRAPLRAIDGFSQALEEDCGGSLGETASGHLRRVRAAAVRMGELIDALLELSRLNRAELRRERVCLSALAEQLAGELRRAEPAREVEFAAAPELWAVGDPRLLESALRNLLGNAWKYSAGRAVARVEFGALERDGRLAYFVRDNGAGFDPAYAGKLFAPFQRLHSPEEFPGHGVGLASVRRIVERHGGTVWAEGAVDRGAAFYFTLPAEPPAAS